MTDSSWMATTAAKYATQVSVITPSGTGNFRILTANPRRWRVSFLNPSGGSVVDVPVPGPVPNGYTITGQIAAPHVSEYPKEPSVTTGEWYGSGAALGGWLVIECLYTTE